MASLSRTLTAVRQYGHLKEDAGMLLMSIAASLLMMVGCIYMVFTQPDGGRFIIFPILIPMGLFAVAWNKVTSSLRKLRESEIWDEYQRARAAHLTEVRAAIAADPEHAMPEAIAMRGFDLVHKPFYT